MDSTTLIAVVSIITAAATIILGGAIPGYGQMKSIIKALESIAQQPDVEQTITRTLFVGLAMLESVAIYCFVISMILIFTNPFWNHIIGQ